MPNIIGKKWWYFAFSALIIVPGTYSLIRYGLRPAIDFTGGSLVEIYATGTQASVTTEKIKNIFSQQKIEDFSISESDKSTYLVRSKPIDNDTHKQLLTAMKKDLENFQEKRFESVGPIVGQELAQKAILSVCLASLGIILYIAYAFRKVPKPYSSWKFGASAVIALLHDVLVVTGIFSILGHFLGVEVDALFVTALLTVIGFSVHDTIVVFDRIRENLPKMAGASFSQVVNLSILQTLVRSLNTSVTVLLTLLAILLFGGETIRWFTFALFIGIASGTYSSIFNAAPILVLWEERGKDK
jgi:preprotein translocase subunit SecF